MKKSLFFLTILNAIWAYSFAMESVQAVRVSTPPKIDGRMNFDEWQQAATINQFFQREPDPGEPASEQTLVKICYDEDNLYFGFRCYLDPKDITAKELAFDASLRYDDRIQIILDTFLDKRSGFWFQVGPRGCYGDALVSKNGAALNKEWDGLWTGRASIHEEGWDVEVAIPFKTLTFRPGQSTWGLKLIRHIVKRSEADYWPTANLDSYRFQVSDAGLLTGLEGISQGVGLDVRPYGLVGVDRFEGGAKEYPADAGVDFFYQVSSGLKSALTVNTDFAQTEVDARQINLTRFSLHFPEKRDFFLDGANYFQFGIEGDRQNPYAQKLIPFFSRRMGLDQNKNPIPIIWGAKVTGQLGRWNIGLMNIMDEREQGRENFAVARISRNIGNQSSFGFIGTIGNALDQADNYLAGFDLKLATSTFRKNKNLSLTLFGLKSNTEGLDDRDRAFGGEIAYPNDFFNFRIGFHQIDENFRAGLGFVPRLGIRETYMETGFGPRPNRWGLLQVETGAGLDYITDMSNTLLTRKINLTILALTFLSGEVFSFKSTPVYELLTEDFAIHTDNTIPIGDYTFYRHSLEASSAPRRNFWLGGTFEWGSFFSGDKTTSTLAFGYKVSVPLFVGLEYEHNDVSLPTGQFDANVYRLNTNILFSPRMTLYNYIQYDNLSDQMGWQTRFAWILKPGNEIMLTWNSRWNEPLEHYAVTESSARFKVRYNYRF